MAETVVKDDSVVTISYTLSSQDGELLDSSEENGDLQYIHGYEGIMPGLERALEGKPVGHSVDLVLSGDDAYGEYDENLIYSFSRDDFPKDLELEPGLEFEAEIGDALRYCVVEDISEDGMVQVNANHPLAGMKLRVSATVLAVRDATEEELDHGHVHDGEHEHH